MKCVISNRYVKSILMCQPNNGEWLIDYFEGIIGGFRFGLCFAKIFKSLERSIAKETHEIDIQNPEIAAGEHEKDSFIDLDAELDMFDINFYVL